MNSQKQRYLLAILPFALVIVFFEIAPLAYTAFNGFLSADTGRFSLENFQKIFSTLSYRTAIANSLWISVISSLAGIVVSFFGAQAIHGADGKPKTLFMTILNMTSNFSGVPLAFAYMIILGNTGVLVMVGQSLGIDALADFNLYTRGGVMLTYIYFQIPFSTLLLVPAFEGVRREWMESNQLFGGSSLTFWVKIGVPVLLPSIVSTITVMFCNALSAFATAFAIMLNNFSLLPINISGMYTGEMLIRKELGGALSLVLMLLMVAAILINSALTKRLRRGE